ncbi:cytochrome P450 [Phyllosticta capitalensis]|uniref:cytochrome P450 n=1 Tax=Phyllosticta capitalensis TaxID=121624 RepID=UPI003132538D
MEITSTRYVAALAPQLLGLLVTSIIIYALARLPSYYQKIQLWRKYCSSHIKFSREAGQGKYLWLEDPWSKSRNYWLCKHVAIKHVFSRSAIQETDHRAGFDWFHFAGWEIPTTDNRYKKTVRTADSTVHRELAKSKLSSLLDSVRRVGFSEIDRYKKAVGKEGKHVSLHTLMYRLGYNVNCIGIFGPDLDHVKTRVILQNFTEHQHMMFHCFNWPLPLWLTSRVVPGARKTVKARVELFNQLLEWYNAGGVATASSEMQAVVKVFEDAGTSPDIGSKFMNMMMIAFLANTPETLGWLFTHLVQSPKLLEKVRAECDAVGDVEPTAPFLKLTPHLYSALFETCRLYVFTGTPATVVKPTRLPGMGDHLFLPGDILHSMGQSAAFDVDVYGEDAKFWKGHRFVGEGESLLKYDLTFGIGRSPCPGRNFAIAELCLIATRMVQTFDFADPMITERLRFDDPDFIVRKPMPEKTVDIIDLDGKVYRVIHPGNGSDQGPPGMTAANTPACDFACKLTPRE